MIRATTEQLTKFNLSKAARATGLWIEAAAMSPRVTAWLPGSMCAASLTLTALGLLLMALGREDPMVPAYGEWLEDVVIAVSFSTVGAVVTPRFPRRNPFGWLFCAIGLLGAVLLFSGEYAAYALVARSGTLPGGEAIAWVVSWLWVVHVCLFAFLGLLFPDGRPPTPRWRMFGWLIGVLGAAVAVGVALSPGPLDALGAVSNPLGVDSLPNLSGLAETVVFSLTFAAAVSLIVRLHAACDVERQQIKWFAYAAVVAAGGALTSYVISDAVHVWWLDHGIALLATVIGLASLPVALGVAILRYRLHDIDIIISQTLVYGMLTAVLAGVFELTLVTLQHAVLVLTHEEDSQLAYFGTALIIAILFEPIKRRIDAVVERRLYQGAEDDLQEPFVDELVD